jgi:hypothetical protein
VAALETSALPVQDEGAPVLGPGELLEVFVGLRQPPVAFDLRIASEEAGPLSAALSQLFTAGQPWRLCRDQLMAAYPVEKRQRRERFAEVMAGQRDFSAAELDSELPDLRRTLARLGATGEGELGPDQFLELLRQQARAMGVVGETTRDQVREWLGAPAGTGMVLEADGQKNDQWTYYHGSAKLPSGSDTRFKLLQVKFNAAGKLLSYTWSGEAGAPAAEKK